MVEYLVVVVMKVLFSLLLISICVLFYRLPERSMVKELRSNRVL